jgi:hypothetical protein
MKLGRRGWTIIVVLGLAGTVALWQGFRMWWYHGYSVGERTGVLRKVTFKGTPLCKYIEGELVLAGAGGITATPEVWTFSTDKSHESDDVVKKLHESARTAKPVTLKYRQDLKSWWRCTPHEYFVTEVIQQQQQ